MLSDGCLLAVDDLRVHFAVRRGLWQRVTGTIKAVDGISLRLAAGETLGLVGESGCGKSTTGRAILRLVPITAGRVRLDGVDLGRLSGTRLRHARRQMQMIFQDPHGSLDPRMTVRESLAEPLRAHRLVTTVAETRRRVSELIARVGLGPEYLGRYPHELSGGQRQRIGIARALALGPRLIVADEPVSALDVSLRAQILDLMGELRRELGLGYLLIAHDLAVVRQACDHVAVMYLGRIVEQAPTALLFAAPQHPYTLALLAAAAVLDPARARGRRPLVLSGEPPSPLDPPPGCHLCARCPWALDRCATDYPALAERAPGHLVACHLPTAPVCAASEAGAGP